MTMDSMRIVDCLDIRSSLVDGAKFPEYKSIGAAGCDLVSNEDVTIEPGAIRDVRTGLSIEIPNGFEAQVRPRSGLALKHGVTVLNSPGTIDSDFRGEIRVILINHGDSTFSVKKGDRIAQLVFSRIFQAMFWDCGDLMPTVRGAGGFGSTGV